MYKIHLRSSDVWGFCLEQADRLEKEQIVIATSDQGIEVCLAGVEDELYVIVYSGDKMIYSEKIINDKDADTTVAKIYKGYLGVYGTPTPPVPPSPPADDGFDADMTPEEIHQAQEDIIYEREDELYLAAVDFLRTVMCIDDSNDDLDLALREQYDVSVGTFIDGVLEMLAKQFFVSVYRPTFIPSEDSPEGEVLDEFPYDNDVDKALAKKKKAEKKKKDGEKKKTKGA